MKPNRSPKVSSHSDLSDDSLAASPRVLTVLHVILSMEIGGMEQVVAQLVQAQERDRFRPVVACLESLGPIGEELQTKGIKVVLLPPMLPFFSFLYPAPLVRLIREIKPDVLHVHSGCWYKTVAAGRICGIKPIIYTKHGRTTQAGSAIRMMDWICSRLTSRVVAVSSEIADFLLTEGLVPKERVSVVINGIDCDRFKTVNMRSGEKIVVGIIARLAPVKDVETLIRATKIVIAECPEVVLRVVGDGAEKSRLQVFAGELGITDKVEFLGFRRDIPAVLGDFDIFALSSLNEGTSISVLEAMAAGKPIVATRVGGNPALIEDGVNGFLVPPGNASELAKALMRLVKDERFRKAMGESNRQKAAREYGIEAMAARYERLYTAGR